MSKESHISFEFQAPYYTLNRITDQTKRVWLVFHGYGQLSKYFIRKFSSLDPEENFIIAPQGLSKYYQEGFSGRVGANWMTKEDRLTDIRNQHAYLDTLISHYDFDWNRVKLVYFGFSQGVATMARFAAHARINFQRMVVWSGTFPPELLRTDFSFLNGQEEVLYFSGKSDPFYKEGMEEVQKQRVLEAMGINLNARWFEGGHEVIPELLNLI